MLEVVVVLVVSGALIGSLVLATVAGISGMVDDVVGEVWLVVSMVLVVVWAVVLSVAW
jgi:hypothetical protein